MLWDLFQHFEIDKQRQRSTDLAKRVDELERELDHTRAILRIVLERLEARLGEDLDGDGQVGPA